MADKDTPNTQTGLPKSKLTTNSLVNVSITKGKTPWHYCLLNPNLFKSLVPISTL